MASCTRAHPPAFALGPLVEDAPHDKPKKNTKKRDRETDDADSYYYDHNAPEVDSCEPDKKHRKKKKNKHGKEKEVEVVIGVESSGVTSANGERAVTSELPPRKKKKKVKVKTKDSHCAVVATTPSVFTVQPHVQPIIAPPIQASTEAELDFSFLLNDEAAVDLNFAGSPPQAAFGTRHGGPAHAQLNNNEDILRAFQELDLTRLAGVLRGLDLPSNPGDSDPFGVALSSFQNDNLASTTTTTAVNTDPPFTKKNRVASGSSGMSRKSNTSKTPAKSTPKMAVNAGSNTTLAASQPIGPSIATPEHTELLSKKWLSSNQLKELVEKEGLVYKKGKFSAIEEQALKTTIENYRSEHGLTQEQLVDIIFAKQKGETNNTFWSELAASVPARPITAVYHHVQRTHHPMKWQGKWTPEEDAAVIQGVSDLGQAWSKVSERVGRTALDCRDRWRNHLSDRKRRRSGKWTKEEEEELTRIVLELTVEKGKTTDSEIFWTAVSQRMKNSRGRQQCRIKWTDSLNQTVKNGGSTPRWTHRDAHILVQRVAALNVRDDSEIDWKTISDKDWNLWSAHILQRRFRTLKHSVQDYEQMPFKELLEILAQKTEKVDESASKPKKNGSTAKRPKSAVTIEDEEPDLDPREVSESASSESDTESGG